MFFNDRSTSDRVNINIDTLLNYIHQGSLFENKLNKQYIKKLIRESLNGVTTHNTKLCHVCRLKSITINEDKIYGILTEEEKTNKLSSVLLMLEKEIKYKENT